MRKMRKSIIILLILAVIHVGFSPILGNLSNGKYGLSEVKAASYPLAYVDTVYASVGETAVISVKYYPAFTNEELILSIYNPGGTLIASVNNTFYNTSNIRYWNVTWDTTGLAAGNYKVVIVKKFYSMYQWNTAPTNSTGTIVLKDDLKGVNGNNSYTGGQTSFACVQSGIQQSVNNSICTAISAWKKTSFPEFDIQLQEMYIGQEAKDIILQENPYNASGTTDSQWILMKYSIKNTGSGILNASDILYTSSFYKYSGANISVNNTPSFSGERKDKGIYDVSINPGSEEEVWCGILVPISQQLPYLKINNTYLNTNPQYASGQNDSIHNGSKKIKENEIPATYDQEGSYEEVIYCVHCNKELSRTVKIIPKLKKTIANSTLTASRINGNTYVIRGGEAELSSTAVNLKTVTIPERVNINGKTYPVTSVATGAFKGLRNLKKVVIGNNVQTIGNSAFANCSKLTTVVIGKNVKKIGSKAFYNCKTLKKITFKTKKLTKKTVGSKAFKGIYKKAVIKSPKSKKKIYKKFLLKKGMKKTMKFK